MMKNIYKQKKSEKRKKYKMQILEQLWFSSLFVCSYSRRDTSKELHAQHLTKSCKKFAVENYSNYLMSVNLCESTAL